MWQPQPGSVYRAALYRSIDDYLVVFATSQLRDEAVSFERELAARWECRSHTTPVSAKVVGPTEVMVEEGGTWRTVEAVGASLKFAYMYLAALSLFARQHGGSAHATHKAYLVLDPLPTGEADGQLPREAASLFRLLTVSGTLEGVIRWDGVEATCEALGWNGLEVAVAVNAYATAWLAGKPPTTIRFAYDEESDWVEPINYPPP